MCRVRAGFRSYSRVVRSLICSPLTSVINHSFNNNLTRTGLIYLHLFTCSRRRAGILKLLSFKFHRAYKIDAATNGCYLSERVCDNARRTQLLLFTHCVQLNMKRCDNLECLFVFFNSTCGVVVNYKYCIIGANVYVIQWIESHV